MNKVIGKLLTRTSYDIPTVAKRDERVWVESQRKNLLQWGYTTYDQLSPEDKITHDLLVAQLNVIGAEIEDCTRNLAISIYIEEGKTQAQAEALYDTI